MKRKRLFVLLLAFVFVLTSVQMTFAKDVSQYYEKGKNVKVNITKKGQFEKKNDCDCYTFVSGGGTYKVKFYSKTATWDDFYEEYVIPVSVGYGEFEYFSPVAGDPPSFYVGATHEIYEISGAKKSGSWYVATVTLDKFSRSTKVGLSFTGSKSGSYKFKIIGKNSPAPAKPALKSVKGGNNKLTVKWGKSKGAKGYQIQYSRNSNFSSSKKVTVKGGSSTSKSFKVSNSGKYYVRVRAYKTVVEERCYGNWSKSKSAKVK